MRWNGRSSFTLVPRLLADQSHLGTPPQVVLSKARQVDLFHYCSAPIYRNDRSLYYNLVLFERIALVSFLLKLSLILNRILISLGP